MHIPHTIGSFAGAALLVATTVLTLPAIAIELGQAAPTFELPGQSGNVRLADLRGKLVYVDFWASWCGPCKQSFPWMSDMQTRYAPRGLQIVAINVDVKPADAAAFLRASAPAFAVAFDQAGLMPKAYGVKAMPSSFLVAPDGKVLRLHSGFRESDRAELEAAIVQALPVRE